MNAAARCAYSDRSSPNGARFTVASRGKGVKTANASSSVAAASPSSPLWIEQWHVVLGDTHARADRTTIATKLLREIKETYKKTHKGGKKFQTARDHTPPVSLPRCQHRMEARPSQRMELNSEVGAACCPGYLKSFSIIDLPAATADDAS